MPNGDRKCCYGLDSDAIRPDYGRGPVTSSGAQVTASLVSFGGGGYPVEKFQIPKLE